MDMRTARTTAKTMYPTRVSVRLVFIADDVPMELTPPPAARRPMATTMQRRRIVPILFA